MPMWQDPDGWSGHGVDMVIWQVKNYRDYKDDNFYLA